MSTSASIPASLHDCIDNSCVENDGHTNGGKLPLSPTLPNFRTECNDRKSLNGSIRMPVEYTTLPLDGQDLLLRLLEFKPEQRIRSIFHLQRIAFFMGFNFDHAKKKKVIQVKSLLTFHNILYFHIVNLQN